VRAGRAGASNAAAANAVRPTQALRLCKKRRVFDVLRLHSMARSSMR
jgi:hypothetical protein